MIVNYDMQFEWRDKLTPSELAKERNSIRQQREKERIAKEKEIDWDSVKPPPPGWKISEDRIHYIAPDGTPFEVYDNHGIAGYDAFLKVPEQQEETYIAPGTFITKHRMGNHLTTRNKRKSRCTLRNFVQNRAVGTLL